MTAEDEFINRAMADVLTAAYKLERLTQLDLAERARIAPRTLQRLLSGTYDVDVVTLARIAQALEREPSELLQSALDRAVQLSAQATKNDLLTKRQEKQAQAREMTAEQLEKVPRRAATRDPEMDSTPE